MRVLLLGASGLLGRVLSEDWGSDDLIPASSKEVDIREYDRVRKLLLEIRPDWTVLAAAYTNVDGCEKNPPLADEVNCFGAVNVARAAKESRSHLLFVSTDYVFDGSKFAPYEVDDPVRPINTYGRSKAVGEQQVREVLPEVCILRTSWLFGVQGRCFPNTILKLAQEQKTLKVVSDQRGSPTFNRDLASVIIRLVRGGAAGTFHATNAGNCSWSEFAQEILRSAGLLDITLVPISTEELKRPAQRPRYSVLSCESLKAFGISMRPWQEAVRAYLQEYFGAFPARPGEDAALMKERSAFHIES